MCAWGIGRASVDVTNFFAACHADIPGQCPEWLRQAVHILVVLLVWYVLWVLFVYPFMLYRAGREYRAFDRTLQLDKRPPDGKK
jgi:hypothetical protein